MANIVQKVTIKTISEYACQCHRNRLCLLTNHRLHYAYRRHPCPAMVRNVWTQGTIAWYVTSAHRPADAHCHPIISCFITIQTGVPFLVPDQPGSPGKEAIKRVSKSDILRRRRTDTGVWPFCPRSLCVVASRPRLGPAIDAATTEPPQSHIEDFFFGGG